MISTALHRRLGIAAGPIDGALLDAAIDTRLAEAVDLDFKARLPEARDVKDSDFPKDVAAMANSGGGLIVYGVAESGKSAAGRCDAGELTEHHERTLRAVAASAIRPPVFFTVHRVDSEPLRAVAIEVHPSPETPHLVFKNHFFGAPLRNDADTQWMSEAQLASAYRARIDGQRRRLALLSELFDQTRDDWIDDRNATMVLVARPDTDARTTDRASRELASSAFTSAALLARRIAPGDSDFRPLAARTKTLRRGLRRWVGVNGRVADDNRWSAAWSAVHDDGAVSMAAVVGGHPLPGGRLSGATHIDSAAIETALSDFLALVRLWGERRGVFTYELEIGIERLNGKPLVIRTVDGQGAPYDGASMPLRAYSRVRTAIDVATHDERFRADLWELAEDCVNQGGIVELRRIEEVERAGTRS